MFSALCLLLSIAILFFILRYRVHVHVSYTPRVPGRRAEASRPTATTRPGNIRQRGKLANLGGGGEAVALADLTSALRGLGCTAAQARTAAERALDQRLPDFADTLKAAIQFAQKQAA